MGELGIMLVIQEGWREDGKEMSDRGNWVKSVRLMNLMASQRSLAKSTVI